MEQATAVARRFCVLILLVAFDGIPVRAADGGCRIDELPRNGVAFMGSVTLVVGQSVEDFTVIAYKCNENQHIIGQSTNFCDEGKWLNPVPECRAYCDPAEAFGVTMTFNCKLSDGSGNLAPCPKRIPPGTIVSVTCKHGYKRSHPATNEVTCGQNGRWMPDLVPCEQVCGEIYTEARPLIVGGRKINVTETPWHAGIYKKNDESFEQICGATILNARVLVSAMHCFWNVHTRAVFDTSEYFIAVGKTKRDYSAAVDVGWQQNRQIERLHYVEGYNHEITNYADDIAVIVLRQAIEFKPHISPVCLPYDLQYDDRTIASGLPMKVAGWGIDAVDGDDHASEHLKSVELSSISRHDCALSFAENKINFIVTSDKFCAGSEGGEENVCRGDSGGGLVLPTLGDGNQTIYFLRGIVSTAIPSRSTCEVRQYSQFTNIAFYLDLIGNYERLHRPENNLLPNDSKSTDETVSPIVSADQGPSTECVLNAMYLNGRVEDAFNASRTIARGDVIPPLRGVRFKCDENYLLTGKELSYCVGGRLVPDVPKCEIIDPGRCRLEKVPENGWVEDSERLYKIAEGTLVEEFTLVRYKCVNGFPPIGEDTNFCVKGKWQKEVAECEATCDTSAIRGITIASTCEADGVEVPCTGFVKNGAKAEIVCKKGYERGENAAQLIECDATRGWWPKPQACSPICGVLNSTQEFNYGRQSLPNKLRAPWHVGIYIEAKSNPGKGEYWYACGGTIVNARFVVTAAHCTFGLDDLIVETSKFRVLAGDVRSSVLLEGAYSGEANQTVGLMEIRLDGFRYIDDTKPRIRDLALFILDRRIIFGDNVAPICLEFGPKDFVPAGQQGFYFGFQKYPQVYEYVPLDALVVPILNSEKCKEIANSSFNGYEAPGLICTGPLNKTDVGYCDNDNGSGLAVPKQIGGQTKYFLHGVVNTYSYYPDSCGPNAYSLAESIHYFKDLILFTQGYRAF